MFDASKLYWAYLGIKKSLGLEKPPPPLPFSPEVQALIDDYAINYKTWNIRVEPSSLGWLKNIVMEARENVGIVLEVITTTHGSGKDSYQTFRVAGRWINPKSSRAVITQAEAAFLYDFYLVQQDELAGMEYDKQQENYKEFQNTVKQRLSVPPPFNLPNNENTNSD